MRALLAILFCFLLAGTQAAFPSAARVGSTLPAVKAKCACSGCETSCCPVPSGRRTTPLPAIPASSQSQVDWIGLSAPPFPALFVPPCKLAVFSERLFPPASGKIPLYEWNCAYLI
jgi:hypothetical protein